MIVQHNKLLNLNIIMIFQSPGQLSSALEKYFFVELKFSEVMAKKRVQFGGQLFQSRQPVIHLLIQCLEGRNRYTRDNRLYLMCYCILGILCYSHNIPAHLFCFLYNRYVQLLLRRFFFKTIFSLNLKISPLPQAYSQNIQSVFFYLPCLVGT